PPRAHRQACGCPFPCCTRGRWPAKVPPMFMNAVREAYQWYLVYKTPFELVGLLLAVSGTVFAVLSIQDGRKLTRDLRAIFDHVTTKEIGAFPAYMTEVERIISEARESIFIATDFPGHGV